MRRSEGFLLWIFTTLVFVGGVAWAQSPVGIIAGTVTDSQGSAVAGATITVQGFPMDTRQTVASLSSGEFEIRQLAPGTYQVEVSRLGFQSQQQTEVHVKTTEKVILQFALQTSPNRQESGSSRASSQTGESSAAQRSASSAAPAVNQISESQLVGLPLNGRSYSQLATLQTGVSDPSSASGSRGTGGGSLNVSGARSSSNVFLLDGTNIMDTNNSAPRSAAGVQLGSDTVLQVQVFSTTYAAEYGRGNGGILNSITRSGSDEFHGTFFEYFRNSKLDARNFFDGSEPPPFKRNQFGFTLTGPLVKQRTYFMGGFEAMRDRLTETNIDYYPDEQARQGFPDAKGIPTVPVSERVKPYLSPAVYPMPNGLAVGRGLGEYSGIRSLPTDENFFVIRIDHKISDRDSLFTRYTFDDASSQSSQGSVLFNNLINSRQQYLTLVETHIFNLSFLNSFRFGYTRPIEVTTSVSQITIPQSLFFVPGAPQFGQINIPGVTPFGPNIVPPEFNFMNTFQFADDLVLQRGPHALKFGLQVHRYRYDVASSWNKGASWSFNSLDSFLQAGPEGTNLTVALPGSDNAKAYRQTLTGLYVQDEYNLSSQLQLTMGLRYEFSTLIKEKYGKTAFLQDPWRDSAAQVGPLLSSNPSLRNWAPRIGATWSPGASRDTVLSAGFGMFYDHALEYLIDQRKNSVPFYRAAVRLNFPSSDTFPNAVKAAEGTPLMAQFLDYQHPHSPVVLRYNFTWQQRLPGGWRTQASYVGARGNHLYRAYEINQIPIPIVRQDDSYFFPPFDPSGPDNRVNPAFGSVTSVSSDAQSFYNALQASASKSLGQGASVQASYTYSKSVDDASSNGGGSGQSSGSVQYGPLRTPDRGLADFHIRQRLSINYFYNLPFGSGQRWLQSGLLAQVLGNWRLAGILSFRTGTPVTPQVSVRTRGYLFAATRPNLLPGQNNNPIEGTTAGCGPVDPATGKTTIPAGQQLGTRELYFDPCVFSVPPPGTPGNAGRNTVIGPGIATMDLSLQKEFSLDSKRQLQFRAEFFNLANHTNFGRNAGGTVIVFSGATGRRNPTAGRLDLTSTTARQIQFALRLSF